MRIFKIACLGFAIAAAPTTVSAQSAPLEDEAVFKAASPKPKPPLPASKLKVGAGETAPAQYVLNDPEQWAYSPRTKYTVFDQDFRSVNLDFSVGLKPKRIMSLQAEW